MEYSAKEEWSTDLCDNMEMNLENVLNVMESKDAWVSVG